MSTTNHGPADHDDDLRRALRDLVDDASLPRLDAHLDVVRSRTRRRRTAKKAALGVTTLCVAGALGVAAVSLPQGMRPEPVAPAESPTVKPAPTPTFPAPITSQDLACREPAPTPTGDDLPAHLSIDAPALTAQSGSTVEAPVTMTFAENASVRVSDQTSPAAYVVAQDGEIVSSPLPLPGTTGPSTPAPGSTTSWRMSVDPLASCDPEDADGQPSALAPGDYQVYALHRLELDSWAPVEQDGTRGPAAAGASFDGWLVSEPVPLTVTTADPPTNAPIEIRDVIGDDDSTVFNALEDAATTGAPAAVDLAFVMLNDWQVVELAERDGAWVLTLPAKAQDLGRERTASDDGWVLEAHGGLLHSDAMTSKWPSNRLVGTYDVSFDGSKDKPTFVLRAVDEGPITPTPLRDQEICAPILEAVRTTSRYPDDLAADLASLREQNVPHDMNPRYEEIKSRWIDSPRVWWAMDIEASIERPDLPLSKILSVCSVYLP